MRTISLRALLLTATAGLVPISSATAQNLFDQLRRSAEKAVERTLERDLTRRTERTVTETIECVTGDKACEDRSRRGDADTRPSVSGPAPAPLSTPAPPTAGAPLDPNSGVWANYDFVPGDRLLFADDLTADRVGNFPSRFGFLNGNMEIV